MLRNSRPYCTKMVPAQTTGRVPASLKNGNNFRLPLLLLTASLFVAGYSNHTVSSDDSGQPPFNTGSGDGNLVNEQSVMTYHTGSNSTPTGLDTFYNQTSCPSSLTTENCATKAKNSLMRFSLHR